jgi:RNA polymerase sigma factor for flagellar operon FliA
MTRTAHVAHALWGRYRETGDPEVRAQLLSQYVGLVHHTVRQIAARVGDAVEFDDLIGAGSLGLVRAFEGFDPDRGIAFTTYATQRVRGAVLDELRAADRLPRVARSQARAAQRAGQSLSQRLGRPATPAEIAGELGVDVATYWEWSDLAEGGGVVPMDAIVTGDDRSAVPLAERLPDTTFAEPDAELHADDRKTQLRKAIALLPEQQRTVLALCYDEGLTLRQIAAVLHVTESRISQVRTAAVKALRTMLEEELG